jgi:purine nucleoside permease
MNEVSRFQLRQTYQFITGAAGVDRVEYTVPAGKAVRVIQAAGFHDDVAARALDYRIVFGAVDYITGSSTSVAANIIAPLYGSTARPCESYILRAGMTLRLYAWSLGAGKFVTMHVALEELLGEDTYGD